MSNDVSNDVMLNEYVMTTNQLIGSVKKYNKKLFDQVKLSYSDLYDEKDKKCWKRYKVLVDLDDSTINKIVKIVTNDTIMKFYDQLPSIPNPQRRKSKRFVTSIKGNSPSQETPPKTKSHWK